MTKEEAIKIIEEAFETWKSEFGEGDWEKEDEALSMAISALEKENIYDDKEHYVTISKALYDKLNVDACNDTISREAVINAIYKMELSNWVKEDIEKMIQQLPSVQPKPIECEDAISREWLMRKATERFYTTNYFNHISAMIEEAPPVEPSRRKGHWIDNRHKQGVTCSECDAYRKYFGFFEFYCPNCDTRMSDEPCIEKEMPCVTGEEMQKCKDIVKKYTPNCGADMRGVKK